MKLQVPEANVARATVKQVRVGEVRVGPIEVGQMTLRRAKVRARSGRAQLLNTRVGLRLAFALDWTVGITIDLPDPLDDVRFEQKGTLDLGSMGLQVGFGDVDLPGLASLSFDIAKLTTNNLKALVGAIKRLQLGPVLSERLRVQGMVAPAAGFSTDGLALGGASLRGLGLPAASVRAATVERACGGTQPIASLTVPDLKLPALTIPQLDLGAVDTMSRPVVTKLPPADAVLLSAALRVTTTARLMVEELRLDDVAASLEVGELALRDLTLPWEVLDLSLSQLGIETVQVPQLEVS